MNHVKKPKRLWVGLYKYRKLFGIFEFRKQKRDAKKRFKKKKKKGRKDVCDLSCWDIVRKSNRLISQSQKKKKK